jgi:hypothetical protein
MSIVLVLGCSANASLPERILYERLYAPTQVAPGATCPYLALLQLFAGCTVYVLATLDAIFLSQLRFFFFYSVPGYPPLGGNSYARD